MGVYCAVDEVRKLRRDARGESLPGAEPDPVRASQSALLEWSERQLCSVDSEEHKHVVSAGHSPSPAVEEPKSPK